MFLFCSSVITSVYAKAALEIVEEDLEITIDTEYPKDWNSPSIVEKMTMPPEKKAIYDLGCDLELVLILPSK